MALVMIQRISYLELPGKKTKLLRRELIWSSRLSLNPNSKSEIDNIAAITFNEETRLILAPTHSTRKQFTMQTKLRGGYPPAPAINSICTII